MQTPNTALSPKVQAILPALENLKADNHSFLLEFLQNKIVKIDKQEIAKKRLGVFKGGMVMSDDFDDYLGDDFWFPDDDILYK
ncbi:hypothetical protein [Moraxella equi]|uniref:DUF2281 domain-containing protein n=1 Tax=Moraxella equi TaxID=60442 RepID=A0A378QQK4_9GAMM|nr:hypothetical protein [Moraxella equi]OPH35784.1 hypothetical protein B5J93_10195 [Moraxella equi]STZ02730.1 Uncharacterised protein [Moraxella equi]